MIEVKLDRGAYMPFKAHREDVGFDLRTPHSFELSPGDRVHVNTGVHIKLPDNVMGLVISKSGLNKSAGITSVGVVDPGYEGPIGATLRRDEREDEPYRFRKGDKISQLVLVPVLPVSNADLVEVEDFGGVSDRGSDGFGSTGR